MSPYPVRHILYKDGRVEICGSFLTTKQLEAADRVVRIYSDGRRVAMKKRDG